jgi:hypothetical protein
MNVRSWHFRTCLIPELSLLSGVKRKLDLETAKGGFWRKAVVEKCRHAETLNRTNGASAKIKQRLSDKIKRERQRPAIAQ